VVGRFFRILADYVEAHELGLVFVAPFDVYLSEHDVIQPDVCFIAKARRKHLKPRGLEDVAPDLVVEVLSPRTRELDLGPKKGLYALNGTEELWTVDEAETVLATHFTEGAIAAERDFAKADRLETDLFPGLEIDLARIFAPF
jgi:Uma2 family endonuclease